MNVANFRRDAVDRSDSHFYTYRRNTLTNPIFFQFVFRDRGVECAAPTS